MVEQASLFFIVRHHTKEKNEACKVLTVGDGVDWCAVHPKIMSFLDFGSIFSPLFCNKFLYFDHLLSKYLKFNVFI